MAISKRIFTYSLHHSCRHMKVLSIIFTIALGPLAPPKLKSVKRLGTNGKEFTISFEVLIVAVRS